MYKRICVTDVFCSGFYPPSDTIVYDEDSEGAGNANLFTRLCSQWEDASRLPDHLNVRKVTVRLGMKQYNLI